MTDVESSAAIQRSDTVTVRSGGAASRMARRQLFDSSESVAGIFYGRSLYTTEIGRRFIVTVIPDAPPSIVLGPQAYHPVRHSCAATPASGPP